VPTAGRRRHRGKKEGTFRLVGGRSKKDLEEKERGNARV